MIFTESILTSSLLHKPSMNQKSAVIDIMPIESSLIYTYIHNIVVKTDYLPWLSGIILELYVDL